MAPTFQLHPRLHQDSTPVGDLHLSRVLLMRDARFPWIVLVPRIANVTELTELTIHQQHSLLAEINDTSQALQNLFAPDKMNIAAIGNMVSQLHIHVVARFKNDAAWPAPIWGNGQAEPYASEALENRLIQIRNALSVPAPEA